MADFPILPLWTDAYIADTLHLDTLEHGAYLLLLMAAWRTKECAIPNDDVKLARFARLTPRVWLRIKPTIMALWIISGDDTKWTQKRLTKERVAAQRRKDKAAAGGNTKALIAKAQDTEQADSKQSLDDAQDAPKLMLKRRLTGTTISKEDKDTAAPTGGSAVVSLSSEEMPVDNSGRSPTGEPLLIGDLLPGQREFHVRFDKAFTQGFADAMTCIENEIRISLGATAVGMTWQEVDKDSPWNTDRLGPKPGPYCLAPAVFVEDFLLHVPSMLRREIKK